MEDEVDNYFQKREAGQVISPLAGVKGVTNNIRVHPRPVTEEDVRKQITDALVRSARLDARSITVRMEGSKVILEDAVHSWAEKEEAENAPWAVPGVEEVENNLRIVP